MCSSCLELKVAAGNTLYTMKHKILLSLSDLRSQGPVCNHHCLSGAGVQLVDHKVVKTEEQPRNSYHQQRSRSLCPLHNPNGSLASSCETEGSQQGWALQFPCTLPGLTGTDGHAHFSAPSNSRTGDGNLDESYFHQNPHKHLAAFTPSLPKHSSSSVCALPSHNTA